MLQARATLAVGSARSYGKDSDVAFGQVTPTRVIKALHVWETGSIHYLIYSITLFTHTLTSGSRLPSL